ncbi:potassium channel family protein [Vallitalea maricola]|uniref:Uncharacterized protein n=1 Tax=Vallitalea maricola TaxID=3074433 RepID=A0ACB5UJS1_9FIRM|nr:hypothetical protein AN2V17_13890 [Vallitalea sp. AN17-2]
MNYKIDKNSLANQGIVIVNCINKYGEIEWTKKYKYIKNNDIVYEKFAKGNKVILNKIYMEGLSLKEYIEYLNVHYPDKEKVDIRIELKSSFIVNADFSNTTFQGKTKFNRTIFKGKTKFNKVTFLDETDFSQTIFLDEVQFNSESTFYKKTKFVNTTFYKVIFNKTYFLNEVTFFNSAFNGVVRLSNVLFKNVDFKNASFMNDVHFGPNANFQEGEVVFKEAYFHKEVDFRLSTFIKVDFSSCKFSDEVRFDEVVLDNGKFYRSVFKKSLYFKGDVSKNLNLEDINIEKKLFINNYKTSIKTMNLLVKDISGFIDLDWQTMKVKNMIMSQGNDTTYKQKADQFILLKENYNKQGHYDDEDNAYVEFKKCMRKSKVKGEGIENGIRKWLAIVWEIIWYIPKLILFELIGGYGTKPKNVFITMILTILGFALIYLYIPAIKIDLSNVNMVNYRVAALYYSGITFLTIGYGDISPLNELTAMVSVVEGFIGIFLMSYFTVSFTRKLLR